MSDSAIVVVTGVFFALIILSGIWVSRKGRPLSVAASTVHKLISLAAGIYLLVTLARNAPPGAMAWLTVVTTGLCFVALVASGGILSSDRPRPLALLRVHQAVPVLTVLSAAAMLYLVLIP